MASHQEVPAEDLCQLLACPNCQGPLQPTMSEKICRHCNTHFKPSGDKPSRRETRRTTSVQESGDTTSYREPRELCAGAALARQNGNGNAAEGRPNRGPHRSLSLPTKNSNLSLDAAMTNRTSTSGTSTHSSRGSSASKKSNLSLQAVQTNRLGPQRGESSNQFNTCPQPSSGHLFQTANVTDYQRGQHTSSIQVAATQMVGEVQQPNVMQVGLPLCSNCPDSSLSDLILIDTRRDHWRVQCRKCKRVQQVDAQILADDRRAQINCHNCRQTTVPFIDFWSDDNRHHYVCCPCGALHELLGEGTGMTQIVPAAEDRKQAGSRPYAGERYGYSERSYGGGFDERYQQERKLQEPGRGHHGGPRETPRRFTEPPPNHPRVNPAQVARPVVDATFGMLGMLGAGRRHATMLRGGQEIARAGMEMADAVIQRKQGAVGVDTLGGHMGEGVANVLDQGGRLLLKFVPCEMVREFGMQAIPRLAPAIGEPIGKLLAQLVG